MASSYLDKLSLIEYLVVGDGAQFKNDIMKAYDDLAGAILTGTTSEFLEQKLNNYKYILNKNVFDSTFVLTEIAQLHEYENLDSMRIIIDKQVLKLVASGKLAKASRFKTDSVMFTELSKYVFDKGDVTNAIIQVNELVGALKTLNLEQADISDLTDEQLIIEDEDDIDLSNLNSVFDTDDNTSDEEDFALPDEEEISLDDIMEEETPESETPESETPESETPESETPESEEENTEDKDLYITTKERKELRKQLEAMISGTVNSTIKPLLLTLSKLYKSGFESMPQPGIYVSGNGMEPPLMALNKSGTPSLYRKADEYSLKDISILRTIVGLLPEMSRYSDGKDKSHPMPSVSEMLNTSVVCYRLHIQFQSAYIKYCVGQTSIRSWITETQLEKSNCSNSKEWIDKNLVGDKSRLTNYKHVESWYRWSLENIMYDALIDGGVTTSNLDPDLINNIIAAVYKNIINVVSLGKRVKGEATEVRISTDTQFNIDDLISGLESSLNVGNDRSITVKQTGLSDGNTGSVRNILIVFDRDKANAATKFAGDILDSLDGNKPSWSHALLGEREDGSYFYWDDFMNPNKEGPSFRCYAMYADSRSGKGIMTSTLLANAMADSVLPFYVDGKPENGIALGDIAWRESKEAFVFNGTVKGEKPFEGVLENFTNGVRTPDEVYSFRYNLPTELFESEYFSTYEQEKYFALMRYIKGLMLFTAIVEGRSAGLIPMNKWNLWIFDEMKAMCDFEKDVRKIFLKYCVSKGAKVSKSKVGGIEYLTGFKIDDSFNSLITPGSDKFDAGIKYINDWLEMTSRILVNINRVSTITLGKASTNVIFIFQQPDWVRDNSEVCTMAKIVNTLSGLKIVGRKGLVANCGQYGNDNVKGPWRDKIDSGGGWWAISDSPDLRSAHMTVFKPFSLFTMKYDIATKTLVDQVFDSKTEERRFFAGYVNSLMDNAGDILQEAYDYINDSIPVLAENNKLVLDTNGAKSADGEESITFDNVKSFMYNVASLASVDLDNQLKRVGTGDEQASTSNGNPEITSSVNVATVYDNRDNNDKNDSSEQSEQPRGYYDPYGNCEDTDSEQQEENRNRVSEQEANLKFLVTRALIRKNYNKETLGKYFDKFIYKSVSSNNFDYTKREKTVTNGLYVATVKLSNLHYLCSQGVFDLDKYLEFADEKISRGQDTNNNFKMAIGMLDSYSNNSLSYDVMPTTGQLESFIQPYMRSNTSNTSNTSFDFESENRGDYGSSGYAPDFEDDNFGESDVDFDNYEDYTVQDIDQYSMSSPEQDTPISRPSYLESPDGKIQLIPRETQRAQEIAVDMVIDAKISNMSVIEKFKKKMFESRNGTAYEFKVRWDMVLGIIEKKFKNTNMVTRIRLINSMVFVNDKQVDMSGIIGGEYDIRLKDIVRIGATFKRFRMLQELVVDSNVFNCIMNEYGTDAVGIWQMFKENKPFKKLIILATGNEKDQVYTREEFSTTANKLDKKLAIEKAKHDIEGFSASKNPRLKDKSPGYIQENVVLWGAKGAGRAVTDITTTGSSFFWKKTVNGGSLFMKNAKRNISGNQAHVFKAAGWSVGAAGLMLVGGAISLPLKLISLPGNIYRKAKNR